MILTAKLDTRKEDLENDLGIAQLKLRRRVRSLLEQNAKILQDYEESKNVHFKAVKFLTKIS